MIRIDLTPEARNDLAEGFVFYEKQETGAGDYFLISIKAEIESLRWMAGTHRQIGGFHRSNCRNFPHLIYYRFDRETISVIAVIDNRRSPEWIRKRLSE
ncbi:type II toxin-antitoxin system RelE/ParE family toxin [Haloferula sp.]|uniref:type II toxin-antitoxin system RelE/ParE family toxin n=1 Tax=Haloferula sp. TaxID=2497595 RepID=UPI003C72EED2